jgi:TRAP-type C4-dicarboxylate transport system substrate-binding protein
LEEDMPVTKTRALASAAVLAVGLGGASVALSQQTINLTLASSHPTTWLPINLMANFFKNNIDEELKKGGKYRINWKEAYAGTLFKLQDTMESIRDNIADIGYVGSVFEADTMPLSNVTFYTPFTCGDMGIVTRALDRLVLELPALQKEWSANNLKYLAPISIETYHVWTKTPVNKFEDLKGRRYNAPGPAAQWLRGTGAVAVDGGLPTYYTNVQTGVTEGAISFYTGILPIRLYEIAQHVTEVDIGAMFSGGIAVTADKFAKLPRDVQDTIVKAGRLYVEELIKQTNAQIQSSKEAMIKAGTKVVALSDADRLRWAQSLPDVGGDWARTNEGKGLPAKSVLKAYMDEVRKNGCKPKREWDKG